MFGRIAWIALLWSACSPLFAADDIRLDLQALPQLQRYSALLEHPGYVAVALENNELSPSLSSKLKVGENGQSAEIRNATIRFVAKNGSLYTYEASYRLGLGDTKIAFPVAVDVSALPEGKVNVVLSPPLAALFPVELTDRLRIKSQLIANIRAQQKLLDYLEKRSQGGNLTERILLDAYNRSGGPASGVDVGDAVPLSDQWLLLLTLIIWLVIVPVFLLAHRLRERRSKHA